MDAHKSSDWMHHKCLDSGYESCKFDQYIETKISCPHTKYHEHYKCPISLLFVILLSFCVLAL